MYYPKCLFSVSSITSFFFSLVYQFAQTHLISFHSRLWEKQVYWRLTLGCVTVSVRCENLHVTLLGPSWWTRRYSEGVKSFVYLWRHCYASHSSNATSTFTCLWKVNRTPSVWRVIKYTIKFYHCCIIGVFFQIYFLPLRNYIFILVCDVSVMKM